MNTEIIRNAVIDATANGNECSIKDSIMNVQNDTQRKEITATILDTAVATMKSLNLIQNRCEYGKALLLRDVRTAISTGYSEFKNISEWCEKNSSMKMAKGTASKLLYLVDTFGFVNETEILSSSSDSTDLSVNYSTSTISFTDDYGCEYTPYNLYELTRLVQSEDENGKKILASPEYIKQFCTDNEIDSTTSQKTIRELVNQHNTPVVVTTATEQEQEQEQEQSKEQEQEQPLTDIDRLNKILEIVGDIENEELKKQLLKPCNAWSKKLSGK